jgi:hypothetical protein
LINQKNGVIEKLTEDLSVLQKAEQYCHGSDLVIFLGYYEKSVAIYVE